MNTQLITSISLLPTLLFILTAIASWFQKGIRPSWVKFLGISSTLLSIIVAAIGGILIFQNGQIESTFLGLDQLGFSIRLDAVSMLMFGMIALLSFIVMKFSFNYLDGDQRQGIFLGRLAATIASVQLFVLSGNLVILFISWVLTSISLHRLLVFYKDRARAIIAARKKFIIARLGDVALLVACILLYNTFKTGNLEEIFETIRNSATPFAGLELSALLIAIAALLKSAQFPSHGWLIEVMETPTPVSALLHAGLLNAGPFLIIRMAFVMETSTYASLLLIIIGAFTALFASVVFLTQTSIKTALGYSSVAHMGFSLMVCGFGVYPAALLHLVAHSFYKAHSFLSSGSVIDTVRLSKTTSSVRLGSPWKIGVGILMALGIYTLFAWSWGIDPKQQIALLAIGAIIVMGLSRLFTSAIDSTASIKLIFRATLLAVIVAAAFFTLESGAHHLIASQIPELTVPNFSELIAIIFILIIFGIVVFIQIAAPLMSKKPIYHAFAIHIRNGFYINTLFDRMVKALYAHNHSEFNNSAPIKNIKGSQIAKKSN